MCQLGYRELERGNQIRRGRLLTQSTTVRQLADGTCTSTHMHAAKNCVRHV